MSENQCPHYVDSHSCYWCVFKNTENCPKQEQSEVTYKMGEQMPIEAQILKAIVETMDCDKCPCSCIKRKHSSKANCMRNWSDTLSQISSDCDWQDIRMQIIIGR